MTEETRNKALRALQNAECALGEDRHFPRVFVVKTHVFFTYMAAVRMQNELKFNEHVTYQIEMVLTPYTVGVNHLIDQRGGICSKEVFPYKEYESIIAE